MRYHPLRRKILMPTLVIVFVLAVTLSLIGIHVVNRLSKDDSDNLMSLACDKETARFNNKLNLVQQSVEIIYDYAVDLLEFEETKDVRSAVYQNKVDEMAASIANRTEGAMSVYFRYSPDLVGTGTGGFLWTREDASDALHKENTTDILMMDKNDERADWYFVPKDTGEAAWISPYEDIRSGVLMISYVIPYYTERGQFVGVIGMDIDFREIMQLSREVNLYETGQAVLADLSEQKLYTFTDAGEMDVADMSTALYNHITTVDSSSRTMTFTTNEGKQTLLCCNTMINGMRLVVYAPLSEINRNRNGLIILCCVVSMMVIAIATVVILRATARLTSPLKHITEVTNHYAAGDWSQHYACHTQDEFQTLSESIAVMARTTQAYIRTISKQAKTDALTGLSNHNRYLEYVETVIKGQTLPEYAVIVCDINHLKKVNDRCGHEEGNALLTSAAKYLQSIYAGSEVFRTGGDEFAVILTGDNYARREELQNKFRQGLAGEVPVFGGEKLSIAFGMAVCPEEGADYDELYRLTDTRMYEDKKQNHQSR